jgi:hypothetical protein
MVPLTATATTASSPTSALVLLALIVTLGYALTCAVWPFRACRRCGGTGRLHGPLRGIRLCRRCTAASGTTPATSTATTEPCPDSPHGDHDDTP